jgi:hypothetical protein
MFLSNALLANINHPIKCTIITMLLDRHDDSMILSENTLGQGHSILAAAALKLENVPTQNGVRVQKKRK